MRRYIALFVLIAIVLTGLALPAVRSGAQLGGEYAPTTQTLFLDTAQGMQLQSTGQQTFAPMAAPRPFSHLLVRRDADIPEGATLQIQVRASVDGQQWSEWKLVEANDDLAGPDDGPGVIWSQIFDVGAIATHWQIQATAQPGGDGRMPTIRQIDVSTVETLSGPATPAVDLPAETAQPSAGPRVAVVAPDVVSPGESGKSATIQAVSKPGVVSRTSWGSPDGQGSRAATRYYPVSHIVVHHTADGNSLYPREPNWAARVRAIWSYHAITRGWGDIGYNYLIDPNGVIYEGRAGGDDAVGFHDTANYGSMGIAMLGTYQSATPTQATRDSLVKLIAWKATQRGIDVTGTSFYYGCTISSYCKNYNDGGMVINVAGHRQVTPGHTTCPGDATMALMPSIRERARQLIAQSSEPTASIDLIGVRYPRTTIAAGELLEVQLTVRNSGRVTIAGQAPQVDLATQSAFTAHVYRQDTCFNGSPAGDVQVFAKDRGRVRVVLGTPTWDSNNPNQCNGATSNYPWRWGLNGDLQPGEERTIIGYVQFTTPGSYTLQAGIVQEYVGYAAQAVSPTQITVNNERSQPEVVAYDEQIRPLAHVYQLNELAESFLAGIEHPSQLPRANYLGSFAWSGEALDWGAGGPFGQSDRFIITQVRPFQASQSGGYTFRVTSDDAMWLLINGQVVVANPGLHPSQSASATIQLSAGMHTLAIVAFEGSGQAFQSYDYLAPGASSFSSIPDPLASQARDGASFPQPPSITIAADDFGGSGVQRIRWSLNGSEWVEQSGAIIQLGRLQTGSYLLRTQAIDALGNESAVRELRFGVAAPAPQIERNVRIYLPSISR
ncbi:MAG: hypothetical protein Fur005_28450 [Roseiflexaceae bacterium]